ncbi:MAG: DHA2 family efflux MFS transporter permease subunit [Candidatus Gastranaerophilaceae bacterium]
MTIETIAEDWKPSINPWLTTIAVMTATFIFVLDGTIANVALPHMAGSFSSSNDEAMWILTSYLVASGIVLPSVGWFSHVFGRKTFFISCVTLFTVASLLCGLSTSIEMMIFSRILQGLGGGAILPIAQAILCESFPKEKRGLAMSVFGLGCILAPVAGPVLGGYLTDAFSWNWIFFINIPFGIIAIICSKLWLEDPPYAQKQGLKKIDYVGFGFLIIWLATLQIVLDKGNNADWFNAGWVCWTFGLSLFAMISFFISQIKNRESIIDLGIFKDKNFAYGTILLVVVNAVMYASTAIMPLFLQNLLGYSAFWSGYALMPRGIGALVAIIITGLFSNIIDERILGITGLLCLGGAGLMFGFLSLQISMMNIIVPNLIFGFGMALCFIPLTTLSMATLNNAQMTNASGVQNLLKNIGGAIGTSLVVTMLSRFGQAHQFSMVKFLNPLNPAFHAKVTALKMALAQYMHISAADIKANYLMYTQLLQQSNLWAFIDAFRIFGLIALIIIPLVFLLEGNKKDPNSEHIAVMH